MSVGVIIPVYNGQHHLEDVVRSVQAQTVSSWELVVVDDGSTDGTNAMAQRLAGEDPRIRLVRQDNAGVSVARNTGLTATTADKVVYLDVDDVWEPHALETLLRGLERAPWAAGAHGLGRHIGAQGQSIRPGELEAFTRSRHAVEDGALVTVPIDQPTRFESEVIFCHVATVGTALFRRAALERAGGFDPNLAFAEDWDLYLRIVTQAPIAFVDKVVLGKRSHEHNVSNNYTALFRGLSQVRRKLLALVANDPRRLRVAMLGRRYSNRLNLRRELVWARQAMERRYYSLACRHLGRAALFSAKEAAVLCQVMTLRRG